MKHVMLQHDQERRCAVRLQNDAAALQRAASERMQVVINRFGERITDIVLVFPKVTTAIYQVETKTVSVLKTQVKSKISPNAGNTFPYPLGPPMIQVFFPLLTDDQLPWLSGLLWIGQAGHAESGRVDIPSGFSELVAAAAMQIGGCGIGVPCLWRQGEWHWGRDLLFIAAQLHRLLTDPGANSPRDAMNPAAAFHWAANKGQLPLEPPVFGVEGPDGHQVKADRTRPKSPFNLFRLE